MLGYITIQKACEDIGFSESHIRHLIKNNKLTVYKQDGYERIYISVEELQSTFKPANNIQESIDLDSFLI